MPQFDKITFFNQIFWLFIFFSGIYLAFLKLFLPQFSTILKLRIKILNFLFTNCAVLKSITKLFMEQKITQLVKVILLLNKNFIALLNFFWIGNIFFKKSVNKLISLIWAQSIILFLVVDLQFSDESFFNL